MGRIFFLSCIVFKQDAALSDPSRIMYHSNGWLLISYLDLFIEFRSKKIVSWDTAWHTRESLIMTFVFSDSDSVCGYEQEIKISYSFFYILAKKISKKKNPQ